MPFYDFLKNIFGIPNHDGPNDFRNNRPNYGDDFRNRVWDEHEDDNYQDVPQTPGFNLFTNPLEIHRYFEQQMDEMMKSFEGFFRNDGDSAYGFDHFFLPNQSEHPQIEPPKENLRDYYLKPGYEHRSEEPQKHVDSDLDEHINAGSFDSLFGNKSNQQVVPHRAPQTRFFGKSFTSRTVQRPDGSVEIHRSTRDNEGNEETTVTRQVGDKQYTVTTRRNKDGKEEKIEDMVNLDEKDVSKFLNIWNRLSLSPQEDPNKIFPFDKFFK